jgi:hypothetical protein
LARRRSGETSTMDVQKLAHAQAVNRVAMGAGLLLAPGVVAHSWAGAMKKDPRTKVVARAMGARDLALGAAGLLAERDGDRAWMRRSYAAMAWADAVDLVAILGAGGKLPLSSRLIGGTLAAGSAAVAAARAGASRGS